MTDARAFNKIALIVEGGGMRGIFAAGVLDAFLEARFDPFSTYFGVSSGADNLSSYIAGQLHRNYRIYTELCTHPEFLNLRKYLLGGHFLDLDWLWQASMEALPFNIRAAMDHLRDREFYIVVTSLRSGKPMYLEPRADTWDHYLKASSSIPIMYRKVLDVEGQKVTDGGISDSIPVQKALELGNSKMVVIRSRPLRGWRHSNFDARIMRFAFRRFPEMVIAINAMKERYDASLRFMKRPPSGVKIIQIAPERLETRRAHKDLASLQLDYEHGLEVGRASMKEIGSQFQLD
ncbi:MAG: patatin family protein [Trueperaceae bacterium]|nr:patatin family protein [Trueperaceae bacterium]